MSSHGSSGIFLNVYQSTTRRQYREKLDNQADSVKARFEEFIRKPLYLRQPCLSKYRSALRLDFKLVAHAPDCLYGPLRMFHRIQLRAQALDVGIHRQRKSALRGIYPERGLRQLPELSGDSSGDRGLRDLVPLPAVFHSPPPPPCSGFMHCPDASFPPAGLSKYTAQHRKIIPICSILRFLERSAF